MEYFSLSLFGQVHTSRCGFRPIPSKFYQGSYQSKGIRRDVASREQRIGNWDRFIVVEENKASLAHFLSTEMSQRYGTHPGCELVVSGGFREILKVWSSDASRESLQELSSDHEEEDTRIVLHARDAAVRGSRQVNMLCRDTDVHVLLLAHRQVVIQPASLLVSVSNQP